MRLDLTDLGFEGSALERFQHALKQPYGMILITGPTGSGKTTTLYAGIHGTITEPIKDLIVRGAPVQELRALAQAQGMKTLRKAGIARVLEGTTTVDEMLRVTLA